MHRIEPRVHFTVKKLPALRGKKKMALLGLKLRPSVPKPMILHLGYRGQTAEFFYQWFKGIEGVFKAAVCIEEALGLCLPGNGMPPPPHCLSCRATGQLLLLPKRSHEAAERCP